MSLKRENKLKKEYQKYYESEPKGKALSYYQWKEAMYPDEMLDKKKKVNYYIAGDFAESIDMGVSFDAIISGGNMIITYTSGATGATMRADVKKFLL